MPSQRPAMSEKLARRIDRKFRGSIGRLMGHRRCFHVKGREKSAFLRAMREAFARHFIQAQQLRSLCREQDFFPWNFKRLEQLAQLPYSEDGRPDHHEPPEVARIARQSLNIFDQLKLRSRLKTNYLSLESSLQGSSQLLLGLTPWSYRVSASRLGSGHWDGGSLLETLERFQASGRPFRLLGHPSDIEDCLAAVLDERAGRAFRFGPRSFVLTCGGWLGPNSQRIDKRSFREKISVGLGLPSAHVRDIYWPRGHNLPFVECRAFRYHIPSYTEIVVRDPRTLQPRPQGQKGRLQFLSPSSVSWEGLSRLSSDHGVVLSQCRCGRSGSVLKLFGEICED